MTTRREFFAILGIAGAASAVGAAGYIAVKDVTKAVEPRPETATPSVVTDDGYKMHARLIRYSYTVDGRSDELQIELVVRDGENYEYVIRFCAAHPWTAPKWLQERFIDIVFKVKKSEETEMYINGEYYRPCSIDYSGRQTGLIEATSIWGDTSRSFIKKL
jgi:hypothetical protein